MSNYRLPGTTGQRERERCTPASLVFLAPIGWMPVDAVGRLLAAVVTVVVGVVVMVGFGVAVTVRVGEVGGPSVFSVCFLLRSPTVYMPIEHCRHSVLEIHVRGFSSCITQ